MIRAESFKALEVSLADRLLKTFRTSTDELYPKVVAAIDSGNWSLAEELVQRISLTPVFDENEGYVQYVTTLAMLFGASRVTKNPGTSVVGMGFEKTSAHQMVQTFRQMLSHRAEAQIKELALQLIALHREDAAVAKADEPAWNRPELALDPKTGKKRRILQPFDTFMDGQGDAVFKIASSLHTSRVSAYGFTAEARALGLKEYQINEQLDARTCPVCRIMHGKKFKVADARAMLDIVTRVTDPEDLKMLQPWPKQTKAAVADLKEMTTEEMVNAGWHIPPFHPRCRGLLARVGKVPTLEQIDRGQLPPERYEATEEDFAALGLTLTPEQIKWWNKNIGLSPAEVVVALNGQSLDEFLQELLGEKPKGIKAKVTKDKVTLTVDEQKVSVQGTSLVMESLSDKLVKAGTNAVQAYLLRMFGLADDLNMTWLETKAGLALDGYSWARYGFKPTAMQWAALKKDIWGSVKAADYLNGMSHETRLALNAALESENPASVFAIADLAEGEALLKGTEWAGVLDLTDKDAVTRFLTSVGGVK